MSRLISEAHGDCYRSFKDLVEALQNPTSDYHDQLSVELLQDEFDKYELWAGNAGAPHSGKHCEVSLDYHLREDSFHKEQILKLLQNLNDALRNAISVVQNKRKNPFEDYALSEAQSDADALSDDDYDGQGVPWNITPSSSCGPGSPSDQAEKDATDTDIVEASIEASFATPGFKRPMCEIPLLCETIKSTVSCLCKIQIRQPAPLNRLESSTTNSQELSDIRYVKDKFPQLDLEVTVRLGRIISCRRQLLSHREIHSKDLRRDQKELNIQNPGTSYASPSKATPFNLEDVDVINSPSSAESESSDTSTYAQKNITIEVPAQPPGSEENMPGWFTCPYCFLSKETMSSREWKKHVFDDLQPYVCTYSECDLPDDYAFKSRSAWNRHEIRKHRLIWVCEYRNHSAYADPLDFIKHLNDDHKTNFALSDLNSLKDRYCKSFQARGAICNLCHKYSSALRDHISRHLQQIALFALSSHSQDIEATQQETQKPSPKWQMEERVEMPALPQSSELRSVNTEDSTLSINAKQFERILKRRIAREKLAEFLRTAPKRTPYLHNSRHGFRHPLRRPRGPGGRFLTPDEIAEIERKATASNDFENNHSLVKRGSNDLREGEGERDERNPVMEEAVENDNENKFGRDRKIARLDQGDDITRDHPV